MAMVRLRLRRAERAVLQEKLDRSLQLTVENIFLFFSWLSTR